MEQTGIELIAQERKEQIEKHGFGPENDAVYDRKLVNAACYLLKKNTFHWPHWSDKMRVKFDAKPRIKQLQIAGALIAAEIDRLRNSVGNG